MLWAAIAAKLTLMPLFFYSIILYLIQPIIVARLFWRSLKTPAHRDRFIQRYGFVSNIPEGCLWIHAVSVGETIASEVMVKITAAVPRVSTINN